jgi:hypothetical protein
VRLHGVAIVGVTTKPVLLTFSSSFTFAYGKNKSSTDEEQKYFSQAWFQALGQECDDGLDASSTRPVHKEREYDCASVGFEESLAEGTSIGNADANVLSEPRRKRVERRATEGTGESQGDTVEANRE